MQAALAPPPEGPLTLRYAQGTEALPVYLQMRQRARSLFRRVSARLGDLAVLCRGGTGDPDSPDDLAVHDEGNTAFQRRGSPQREEANVHAPLCHQVFEHFARTAEVERAARLVFGDRDGAILRVVELMQHHDMAGAVQNG